MFFEFFLVLYVFEFSMYNFGSVKTAFYVRGKTVCVKPIVQKHIECYYKLGNLAKTFLQLCQKCILLAWILYFRKMFPIEKALAPNINSKLCAKVFRLLAWKYQQVGQTAFSLWQKPFWRKVFQDGRFVRKIFQISIEYFWAGLSKSFLCLQVYGKGCYNCILRVQRNICGKTCFWNISELRVFVDLWWTTFCKFFKNAFYVCTEAVWVEPFFQKFLRLYIKLKKMAKKILQVCQKSIPFGGEDIWVQ